VDYFASAKCEMISLKLLVLLVNKPVVISFPLSCLQIMLIFYIFQSIKGGIMSHYLLRIRSEVYDRIRLFAKQENISINKMIIKLISIGMITYLKGGMSNENVVNQVNSK